MPSTSAPRRLLLLLVALALVAGGVVGFAARGFAAPPQPHMREALEALRNARHHLDQAAPDHGGHRARAIQLTDQAIAETQAGIGYTNHH